MKVLVTGATGFIGSWTLPALTAAGHEVLALIRKPEQAPVIAERTTQRGGNASHLQTVIGDLGLPGLGVSDPIRPDAIVHLGASFAWNLDPEVARTTNVNGSLEVVRLAARHDAALTLIGGYMLANQVHLQELGIDLNRPDDVDWARVTAKTGVYEASKLESHARSIALANELGVTWQAIHPATLCGHSNTGELAVGQPLRELIDTVASGRMPAVPGSRHHWLPLVTVDHLASLIVAAVTDVVPRREILALDDHTPSLVDLVNMIASASGRRSVTARVPIGLLRVATRVPGVRRLVPASRESLAFIRTERFDLEATRAFEATSAIHRPDIHAAVVNSVRGSAAETREGAPTA